jgi:hypothetical protein
MWDGLSSPSQVGHPLEPAPKLWDWLLARPRRPFPHPLDSLERLSHNPPRTA